MVKLTFHEKGCCEGDFVIPLGTSNSLPESLELMHILGLIFS